MSPRNSGLALLAALGLLAPARAQDDSAATPLERFLTERNLDQLAAHYLLGRLRDAEGPERLRLAERLSRIYVAMLDAASTPDQRERWEARSQELLRAVPEAESADLRLTLAKARYFQAEQIGEAHRLRGTTPEQRQEAERVLRAALGTFQDIASKMVRRVEMLERREAEPEPPAGITADLDNARRLRSLGMYYAGWAGYYLALVTAKPQPCDDAIVAFGWLLNSSGRPPGVERVPVANFRLPHVARSAIGVALCESLRGRDTTAERWLDAVASAEGLDPQIAARLPFDRLVVLGQARRWTDLALSVKVLRSGGKPLPPREARLIAVLALEAQDEGKLAPAAREPVQALADGALSDLIARGETDQVLSLVSRFGTTSLGGEGFMPRYIRGVQAYQRARDAHAASDPQFKEPASAPAAVNLYREAASLLELAATSPDADRFAKERADASLRAGLALFGAGDLERSADRLEALFRLAGPTPAGDDALWLAIVSIDKAVERGKPSLKDRLAQLAALYFETFPKSERATMLLLRRGVEGAVTEAKAAEVLLNVPGDSPLYLSARRRAADALYRLFRRAAGPEREHAALRFVEVADEVSRLELRDGVSSFDAATAFVERSRRLLDAALAMRAPDLDRAARTLDSILAVADLNKVDLAKVEDELTFRRFQIALARDLGPEIDRHLETLHRLGGPYAQTAERRLYNLALARSKQPNPPADINRQIVRHGLRVAAQFHDASDPAAAALFDAVANAAAALWRAERDQSMRDAALELDRAAIASKTPPPAALRRFAELAESAGDAPGALDAWRRLVAGLPPGSSDWYEARYHSLRLLAAADPAKAREAMAQHRVLNPDFGPEPWGPRLRALADQIDPGARP
ncbi:MAG: hypothetical protein JNM80_04060 [Phycisphaerae bacterium]|nr:hypothetical protein [Phycisphaerae bacterium]